jgi:enoyl-CoA hydratase/carnithine racemase
MTALVEPSHDHHLVATFCRRLETLGKPSIAAVDGVCTAGGLEIAVACDVRLVSETAEVSDLHVRNLGSLGGAGVTVRLPRTVGQTWAKEIMFSGDSFNGDQAVRMGFANHSYPPGKLLNEAISLARKFTGMSESRSTCEGYYGPELRYEFRSGLAEFIHRDIHSNHRRWRVEPTAV